MNEEKSHYFYFVIVLPTLRRLLKCMSSQPSKDFQRRRFYWWRRNACSELSSIIVNLLTHTAEVTLSKQVLSKIEKLRKQKLSALKMPTEEKLVGQSTFDCNDAQILNTEATTWKCDCIIDRVDCKINSDKKVDIDVQERQCNIEVKLDPEAMKSNTALEGAEKVDKKIVHKNVIFYFRKNGRPPGYSEKLCAGNVEPSSPVTSLESGSVKPMRKKRGEGLHAQGVEHFAVIGKTSRVKEHRTNYEKSDVKINGKANKVRLQQQHNMPNGRIEEKNLDGGALWDIFRREDVPKLEEYLIRHYREFRHFNDSAIEKVYHPIYDQTFYLTMEHKMKLKDEYGIEPWTFVQKLGEAVFIPAGCPHQVRNLKSCIKVALDFVSPENVRECIRLTEEFRLLPQFHRAKEDKLEVRKMALHALLHVVNYLEDKCIPRENKTGV